jgi:protoheme ferro-lyase
MVEPILPEVEKVVLVETMLKLHCNSRMSVTILDKRIRKSCRSFEMVWHVVYISPSPEEAVGALKALGSKRMKVVPQVVQEKKKKKRLKGASSKCNNMTRKITIPRSLLSVS